jgi:hypothetical protein
MRVPGEPQGPPNGSFGPQNVAATACRSRSQPAEIPAPTCRSNGYYRMTLAFWKRPAID